MVLRQNLPERGTYRWRLRFLSRHELVRQGDNDESRCNYRPTSHELRRVPHASRHPFSGTSSNDRSHSGSIHVAMRRWEAVNLGSISSGASLIGGNLMNLGRGATERRRRCRSETLLFRWRLHSHSPSPRPLHFTQTIFQFVVFPENFEPNLEILCVNVASRATLSRDRDCALESGFHTSEDLVPTGWLHRNDVGSGSSSGLEWHLRVIGTRAARRSLRVLAADDEKNRRRATCRSQKRVLGNQRGHFGRFCPG